MGDDIAALIAEVVAQGRVTRVPFGYAVASRKEVGASIHPDLCGCGGEVTRAPFLDELDGDSSRD